MPLSQDQQNVINEIIDYGTSNGFSEADIQLAVNSAYIESSLGSNLDNPDSTVVDHYS